MTTATEQTLKMTDTQKYLFDLQGFVVVEDVLTDDECETAKDIIKRKMKPMAKTPDGYEANGTWHSAGGLLEEGNPFIRLIDEPKVNAVLTDIISPMLRLEGAYSFVRMKNCPPFEMHGGFAGGRVNFRYSVRGNKIYTGLTVVSYALQDIDPADGGFACIPGSHKSDFHVPAEDRKKLFAFGGPLVRNIGAPKGAAIIFTETLAHGANSWQQDEPRFGLFYKFNDRAAIYHDICANGPTQKALDQMTDEQKCYFNRAFQGFGTEHNRNNMVPEPVVRA